MGFMNKEALQHGLHAVLAGAARLVPFGLSFICIAVFAASIYRALFHPLARYPGPFLARFTNLYSAYHAWKGDIHVDIYKCHERFGPRVRYAPNRVIFNTAGAIRDIYGHQAKVTKFKNYEVLSRQAANTLTLRDKGQHARRRRVVSQAFSESSLRLFEPKIISRLERFCGILRKRSERHEPRENVKCDGWSEPMDMSHECSIPGAIVNNLAFDAMTAVLFDMDFDTLGSAQYRYALHAIEDSNVRLGVLLQAPELSFGGFDSRLFPKALSGRYKFVKFIRMLLAKRLAAPKAHSKDLFSFLQECSDPDTGKGLSVAELSTETATFIVAGADTSSTTMAAVSHYLTGSSHWYQKAAQEVRSTFSSLDEIRLGPKLNACVCLRACVDESLRLSPPGGSALWREVESGGAIVEGEFLPAGSEVAVGVYSIHHSPEYYQDPFRFDASRWYRNGADKAEQVESSSTSSPQHQQHLPYMPFSVGPRSCVGKPLAIAQIMLIFARLLWEFDLRRAESGPGWEAEGHAPTEYVLKDHLTAQKEGPLLCFRPRDISRV